MSGSAVDSLGDLPEWPGNPRPHGEDVFSSTSRLCLECGLCCTGALFGYVALTAEEITSLAKTPIRPYGQSQPGEGEDADGWAWSSPAIAIKMDAVQFFPIARKFVVPTLANC